MIAVLFDCLDISVFTDQGKDKFYFLPLDSYGWVLTVVMGHIYKYDDNCLKLNVSIYFI